MSVLKREENKMPKPKLLSTRKPRQTTSAPAPTPAPTPAPPGKGSWARNALGRARSALSTTQGRAQVANALLDAASVASPAGRARSVAARAAASPTGRRVVAATTQAARRAATRAASSPTFRAGARAIRQGASEVGRAAVKGGRNIAGRVAGSVKGGKGGFVSKAVQVGSLVALGLGLSRGKNEQKPESQQNTPTPAPNKPTENKASSPQPTPRSSDSSSNKSASSSEYKVYAKDSAEAKDFRANFAKARKSGDKEFTWEGRKYNTKLKGE